MKEIKNVIKHEYKRILLNGATYKCFNHSGIRRNKLVLRN